MATLDLSGSHRPAAREKFYRRPRVLRAIAPTQLKSAARWTMLLCSLIALASSSYLAWSAVSSSPVAGCGGSELFDCEHVLHSRWSTVLGIPVSFAAMAAHAMIISLLLVRPVSLRGQQIQWTVIGAACLSAGLGAFWFIGLQVFALGHICPYCFVAHVAGMVSASVFLISQPLTKPRLLQAAGVAGLLVVALIGLQMLNSPPTTYEVIDHQSFPGAAQTHSEETESKPTLFAPPESAGLSQRENYHSPLSRASDSLLHLIGVAANPTSLIYGQVTTSDQITVSDQTSKPSTAKVLSGVELSTRDWPLVGNPNAPTVLVELFDYTCPHCQKTHAALDAARKQMGDEIAVITLPVPLDAKCNSTVKSTHPSHREACEIAKLAIAVWLIDPQKFAEFHDFLFQAKPNYATALATASGLVNRQQIDETLRGPVPGDYIQKHVALYQQAGGGAIPKLLFPNSTATGAVESPEAMVNLIRQQIQR